MFSRFFLREQVPRYRASRHKARIDHVAGSLVAQRYLDDVVADHLREWLRLTTYFDTKVSLKQMSATRHLFHRVQVASQHPGKLRQEVKRQTSGPCASMPRAVSPSSIAAWPETGAPVGVDRALGGTSEACVHVMLRSGDRRSGLRSNDATRPEE